MPRRPRRPWQSPPSQSRSSTRERRGPRVIRVDLHGYDVLTALDLARRRVAEAYENGFGAVELLHGAADVKEPVSAGQGRGAIKWELRRMHERGQFNVFSSAVEMLEGMMRLRLRSNPRPRPESWSEAPPRTR